MLQRWGSSHDLDHVEVLWLRPPDAPGWHVDGSPEWLRLTLKATEADAETAQRVTPSDVAALKRLGLAQELTLKDDKVVVVPTPEALAAYRAWLSANS